MITDQKLIKRADALVDGVKPDDVHPDLAALMHGYKRQRDRGHDAGTQAHARSLVRLADQLGVEAPKSATKKSTTRRKG